MILTITFLQWLFNELLIILISLITYSDPFTTVYITAYTFQLCFGGIIWFVISKKLNNKFGKKKSFNIPIMLIGICFISTLIHIVLSLLPSVQSEKVVIGILKTFFCALLPLCHFIVYLLCYGIQWLISKLPKKQLDKPQRNKRFLVVACIIQWLFGCSYVLLAIALYFNDLINNEFPKIDFSVLYYSLFFCTYVIEITIGGLIWYLIYRYATKHNILTKLKAFFVPIVFMAISVITGFLLPPVGTYFQYLGNVLQVFCQICQFVVYLLTFLVAYIIQKFKSIIKKRETN